MNVRIFSSILDYPHPGLDPDVWDSDGKLLPKHKEALLSRLDQNLKKAKLSHFEEWAKYIHIVGSLTTYQYMSTSDCDVHIYVDLPKFIEFEKPGASTKEAEDFLDLVRKESFDDKAFDLPGTKHPVEYYFVTPKSSDDTSRVGIYDVWEDKWDKDPVKISVDFDIEKSKPKFIEEAAKMAGELDISLGDIKRQISRIEELQETIKVWDAQHKKLFKEKLEEKLEHIEAEIQELVDVKTKLVQTRHTKEFDATSEDEIKFKYLQRFGYFYIITQLKELLAVTEDSIEVTVDKVPEIKEIVTEPVKKVAYDSNFHNKLMIDFDQTIARNTADHTITEPMPGVKEAFDTLKAEGWNIIIYSARANSPEGMDDIREFMKKYNIPYDEIFVGKPIAEYYIDDRNIVFTDWKDVLKTIDHTKNKKKASIGDVRVWLSPRGKVYTLDTGDTHDGWARRNMGKSLYDLIETGWVRIGDSYEDSSAFNIELGNKNRIPTFLDEFIVNNYHGGSIEVEDDQSTVQISNPFPNLQKAVNDAIVRQRMVAKTAQHNVEYDYSSTHFVLPKDIAQKIVEWSVENIPNEDLFDDETKRYGRELESHITVLFGLLTNDSKEVEKLLKNEKPVRVKFKKTKVFENDMDAIFIEVDSEDIERLHSKLKELKNEDQQPDYHPHCTVAYVESGLGKKYAGVDILDGLELELDTVKFSPKEGDPVFIELGGKNKKEASDQVIPINNWGSITKNPTADDAEDLLLHCSYMELRWGATDNGDLYIWNANSFTHHAAASYLGLNFGHANSNSGFLENVEEARDMANKFEEKRYSKSNPRQKAASFDIVAALIEKKAEFYWMSQDGKVEPAFKLKPEVYKEFLNKGWIAVDDSHSPVKVWVYDFEMIPDFLDSYLGKKIGYGENAVFVDRSGHEQPVRFPTKNIKRQIHRELYPPEDIAAAFQPSIATPAPDNHWQTDSDVEIPLDPDTVSDEETYDRGNIVDKPQKGIWHKLLDFFKPDDTPERVAKKAYLEHAYWIAPDGKSFTVRGAGENSANTHGQWAKRNREKLKEKYGLDIDPGTPSNVVTEEMVMAGWARIGDAQANRNNWAVMVKDLHSIPSSIDNLLASFLTDGSTIYVESLGDGGYVEVTYPFKSLQNEVNRQFRSQNQMAASLERKAYLEHGYWIAPDGVVFTVRGADNTSDTHDDWVNENINLLKKYGISIPAGFGKDRQTLTHIFTIIDDMYEKGWVRIGDSSNMNVWGVLLKDIRHIPSVVEHVLTEFLHDGNQVTFESEDYEDAVTVEYPWRSLQKEINRQLHEDTMATIGKKADVLATIIQTVTQTGGATWNFSKGNLAGTDNYAVSIYPEHTVIVNHELTIEDLSAYVNSNRDMLSNPENSLGIWNNGGKYYLDISLTIPDLEKAKELGRQHNQISIFDLKNFVEIPTGGTGEAQSKQAKSIEEVNGVKVLVNPTPNEVQAFWQKSRDKQLRALVDPQTGDIFAWDAWEAEHDRMIRYFDLNIDWEGDDGSSIRHVANEDDINYLFEAQSEIKKKIQTVKSSLGLSKRASEARGWIDPNGQFFSIGEFDYQEQEGITHADFIMDDIDWLVSEYHINKEELEMSGDPVAYLVDQGWIRITDDNHRLGIQIASLQAIPDSVDKHLLETTPSDEEITIEDNDGYSVTVTDWAAGLQKAVNKELRRKRMIERQTPMVASLGLSKRASFDGAGWVDPKGKIFKVPYTHAEWVSDNMEMLENKYGYSIAGSYEREPGLLVQELLEYEWVRIAEWRSGEGLIQIANLGAIPPGLQPFVDENYDWEKGNPIIIEDISENHVEVDVTGNIQEDIDRGRKFRRAASLERTAFSAHAYWIAPDKKVYEVRGQEKGRDTTHAEWVFQNRKLLRQKYKTTIPVGMSPEDSFDANSILIEKGWTRIGDYHGSQIGIRTLDIHNIPSIVDDVLATFATEGSDIHVEDIYQDEFAMVKYPFKSLQREVNRSLSEHDQQHRKQRDMEEVPIPDPEPPYEMSVVKEQPQEHQPEQMELPLSAKSQSPSTTWDGTEPFTPLPTTFEWGTNDDNLNSRYPWKFMKKPTGPDYSNEDEVNDILIDDEKPLSKAQGSLKTAATPFRGWLDPRGNLYPLEYGLAHGDWIRLNAKILQKQGISYPRGTNWVDAIEDLIINHNWIRIDGGEFTHSTKSFSIMVKSLHDVPSSVDVILMFLQPGDELIVEDVYATESVSLTAPIGNIDKEIRRAERDQEMQQAAGLEYRTNASLKTARSDFAVWIDPNGKIYTVREKGHGGTHLGWIETNVDALRKEYHYEIPVNGLTSQRLMEVYERMLKDGWIRIGDSLSRDVSISIQLKDLHNIPSYVDDYLATFYEDGMKIEVEEGGTYTTQGVAVALDNPFPTLQKAVNQALVSKLPLAASLDVEAFSRYGLWVASDGKTFDVRNSGGRTHGDWVIANMGMLSKTYHIDVSSKDYYEIAANMLKAGWARIGDTSRAKGMPGVVGVEVASIKNLPSYIDDALASILEDRTLIIVADLGGDYAEVMYPFKSLQNAVRRALRGSKKTAYSDKDVRDEAYALWQDNLASWDAKVHPIEHFIMENGGIASYRPSGDTRQVEEREEYRGIPVRLRGQVPYDEMADRLKSERPDLLSPDAAYGDLYEIISHLPERGRRPRLNDFIEEANHYLEYNESNAGMMPREKLYNEAGNESNTYTDHQMEEIYDEQHAEDQPGGETGGGHIFHDWNQSTNDFPKPEDDEQYQKVYLDELDGTPVPIASYEVTWYVGSPGDDNGSM